MSDASHVDPLAPTAAPISIASSTPSSSLPTLESGAAVSQVMQIAPWWHTLCILVLLLVWATLSGSRHRSYEESGSHYSTYLSQIMLSWMLFGTVIAGITDRGAFFARTIGSKLRAWKMDSLWGLSVYGGIYGVAIAITLVVQIGNFALHPDKLRNAITSAQTTTSAKPADRGANSSNTTATPVPAPAPASPDPFAQFRSSKFHMGTKTVLALAPRSIGEMLVWVLIAATAGFSEEHIFRGYLLTQARAYARHIGMSGKLGTIIAVAIVSLIFGSLHLYEGLSGAALITCLGAVYAVVSMRLRNLRAVIVAHFLQDFVAGFFLFVFHSFYSRLLS